MARDDNRFLENASIAFAIYCDENGLTRSEGWALADRVSESVVMTAEDRPLPDELEDGGG